MWREPDVEGDWRPTFMRRRPYAMRLLFSCVWLAYLIAPLTAYLERHPPVAMVVLVSCGLALLVASYVLALSADVTRHAAPAGVAAWRA